MAVVFICPECLQQLRVNEGYRGQRMRCPKCSAGVTVPESDDREVPMEAVVQPSVAPPRRRDRSLDDRWEEEDERKEADRLPGLGTVRAGLGVLSTGVMIVLVTLAVSLTVSVLGGVIRWQEVSAWKIAAHLAILLALIILIILWLVGLGMCMATPEESNTKGWAVSAFLVSLLSVMLVVIGILTLIFSRGDPFRTIDGRVPFPVVLLFISIFVLEGGIILHLLFLRGLAVFFRNYPLGRYVLAFLAGQLVFFLTCFLLTVGVGLPRLLLETLERGFRGLPPGQAALVVAFFVILLGLLIGFIALGSAARSTIPRPGSARTRPES
jgi:hypothetical protein